MSTLRGLIACEESQAVCIEFRKLGIETYSCDIIDCSGGHPEWHIKDDVLKHLDDGWDFMLAFPPCTHLAVSGAAWFEQKRKDGRQQQGIDFFMAFTKTNIPRWAIENPIGIMSKIYRKPDQIIHPYYFGDSAHKPTCLWLKNFLKLVHSNEDTLFYNKTHVYRGDFYTTATGRSGAAWNYGLPPSPNRSKIRSKTFPGIAHAMATQWGEYLLNTHKS